MFHVEQFLDYGAENTSAASTAQLRRPLELGRPKSISLIPKVANTTCSQRRSLYETRPYPGDMFYPTYANGQHRWDRRKPVKQGSLLRGGSEAQITPSARFTWLDSGSAKCRVTRVMLCVYDRLCQLYPRFKNWNPGGCKKPESWESGGPCLIEALDPRSGQATPVGLIFWRVS